MILFDASFNAWKKKERETKGREGKGKVKERDERRGEETDWERMG